MGINMNENIGIKGRVRFIECDGLKYPNYEDIDKAIRNGDAKISQWYDNIIPTAGRTAICRRLVNEGLKSNEGIITYGAVGTGGGTPANGDTTLTTELARKLVSSNSYVDNSLEIRVFFTTTEGNGTLTEYGLFGEDASASADSGTLFERVLISKTKTSSITLTVVSQITIN